LSAPPGTKLDAKAGLLTWTPSSKAGRGGPQELKLQGCAADGRCVEQAWNLSAYGHNLAPAGPPRSFKVLDSVVKGGQTIELRSQGVDEKVTVKIDGQKVRARILDEQSISVKLPKKLAKGPHDVSLQIGGDLEEKLSGAIVVL